MTHSNRRNAIALALGLLLLAPTSGALLIDDFAAGALVVVGADTTENLQYSGGTILGGDREETVVNIETVDPTGILLLSGGSAWSYGASNAPGTALLTWDGAGGSSPGLDFALGGEDFTEAGAHDAIGISVLSNDLAANITLTAYTDGTNFSTITLTSPGSGGPFPFQITGEYTSFAIAGGTGADFASIAAFTLEVDGLGLPDLDMAFDFIETFSTTPVPEPGTASLMALGIILLAYAGRARRRA